MRLCGGRRGGHLIMSKKAIEFSYVHFFELNMYFLITAKKKEEEQDTNMKVEKGEIVVYILDCPGVPIRQCYVGYTNNLEKRILKHNGKLVGGAKKTHRVLEKHPGKEWIIAGVVRGFIDHHTALCFEARMHHPSKKRKSAEKKVLKETAAQWKSLSKAEAGAEKTTLPFIYPVQRRVILRSVARAKVVAKTFPAQIRQALSLHVRGTRGEAHEYIRDL